MTQEQISGLIVGLIFLVLGFTILVRYKKLTSHKYFQILVAFIGIILVGFGIYMAINGFFW